MALFDDEGRRQETLYDNFLNSPLVTCEGDTTISLHDGRWVRPGGEAGQLEEYPQRNGTILSKSSPVYFLWRNDNVQDIYRITSVSSVPPEIESTALCNVNVNASATSDVSKDGKFFAFCYNGVTVFDKIPTSKKTSGSSRRTPENQVFQLHSTYASAWWMARRDCLLHIVTGTRYTWSTTRTAAASSAPWRLTSVH